MRRAASSAGSPIETLFHLKDFSPEPGFWVADLRLQVATDKGWLSGRDPIPALPSVAEQRAFAERLAMLQSRPALDSRFETAVSRPFIAALRELGTDSDLGRAVYREVYRFAVRADDPVHMGPAEVWILSVDPLSEPVRAWLDERSTEWLANATETGLQLLPTQFSDLRSMTAEEYVSLTLMPLAYVSPDPPWFGVGTPDLATS